MKYYYVYILSNGYGNVIYVGVTNNLKVRVYEHKNKMVQGFSSRYNINKLIYYETTSDIQAAISREKEIKGWRREKKLKLVDSMNPERKDLSAGWFE